MLTSESVSELTYEEYQLQQQQAVSPTALREQAERLKASDKFKFQEGSWRRMSYPGYAVLSMMDNNPGNGTTQIALRQLQQRLVEEVSNPQAYFLLPPDSFHQTIANTLSAERFRRHIVQPGLEKEYPTMVGQAVAQIDSVRADRPLEMQLTGLSIFGSALGILGVFNQREDFERIIRFRHQFYAHPELNGVGVRCTRPFIGHVTLAYVDGNFAATERTRLADVCTAINEELNACPLPFLISKTELRNYPNLAEFHRQPQFPTYSFLTS